MRLGKTTTGVLAVALFACSGGNVALGGVIQFFDRDEWIAAVGEFTTLDFTGFPDGTFITDQYADLGVLFTDANDTFFFNPGAFPNDEWGVDGNGDINVSFENPQLWIGVDFPGLMQIELFSGGQLIYTSSEFLDCPGAGCFAGLLSSQLFDAARLIDPAGEAAIDDLHFGVPGPGGVALFVVAASLYRRRRRGAHRGQSAVKHRARTKLRFGLILVLVAAVPAQAGVIEFEDPAAWEAAVGDFTTIDFTGYEDGEFITDQYADLGILFTDANDTFFFNPGAFPNDEWGVDGNGDINVSFENPQLWIGVDFPGFMQIELFSAGQLIYTSSEFLPGGAGNFAGLISSEFFDAARLIDPAGEAAIDDLHLGVPGPGGVALFVVAASLYRRRRR